MVVNYTNCKNAIRHGRITSFRFKRDQAMRIASQLGYAGILMRAFVRGFRGSPMAHHEEQDRQSLMLHTEAVQMMQADPALIDRALRILDRWEAMKSQPHPSHVEWRRILLERDWAAALSTSERGNQIRQSSPMSCVLPNEKRLAIMQQCRREAECKP